VNFGIVSEFGSWACVGANAIQRSCRQSLVKVRQYYLIFPKFLRTKQVVVSGVHKKSLNGVYEIVGWSARAPTFSVAVTE
jgi:hypothetical protein